MINTVLWGYLIGWIITSAGLALTTRGQSRPASVIVAAGVVWPILILAMVQFAAIALVAAVVRNRAIRKYVRESLDTELDAILIAAARQ